MNSPAVPSTSATGPALPLKKKKAIPEKRKEKNEINKYNEKTYEELNKVDNDESSNSSTSIYDENASAIEQNNEKIEVEKKNKYSTK